MTRFDKYGTEAAFSRLAKQWRDGVVTIRQIANAAKCTSQAVGNDLEWYLGKSEYRNLQNARRERKRELAEERRKPKLLNKEEVDVIFAQKGHGEVAEVLSHLSRHGVKVDCMTSGTSVKFVARGQAIAVRAGIPRPEFPEYNIGYYRFKITPNLKPINVFGICDYKSGKPIAVYVFERHEIEGVKSLNLRFRDIHRKWNKKMSKYANAYERFSLLK